MAQRILAIAVAAVLIVGAVFYFRGKPGPVDLAPAGSAQKDEGSERSAPPSGTSPSSEQRAPTTTATGSAPSATADPPAAGTAPAITSSFTFSPSGTAAPEPTPSGDAASKPRAPRPILENWPTPAAAFVLSGEMHGYVEPCGCSLNQLGGLSRRADLFRQIRERGWPVVGLDAGGLVSNPSRRQAKIKLRMAFGALRELEYAAVALGLEESQIGVDLLQFAEEERPPLVSCNVVIGGADIGTHLSKTVFTVGKLKVGVTGVVGNALALKVVPQVGNPSGQPLELEVKDAVASLTNVVAELEAEKPDLMVLLSHARHAESKELAEKFPQFQLIVSTGGPEDPDTKPHFIGKTLIVAPGQKGKHVPVVAYYPDNAEQNFRYEAIALDEDRFQETPAMHEQMRRYQEALAVQDLVSSEPRIEDPRNAQLSEANPYVGSKVCGDCHTRAYQKWLNTGHAKGTESIKIGRAGKEANHISRIHDPECVACHVTGWDTGRDDPKDFLGYKSGYVSEALTPLLVGQGCENCHGPGGRHVELERQFKRDGKETDELTKFREFVHLELEGIGARQCVKCHDGDNDPHFKTDGDIFEEYWKKIVHPRRD